VADAVKKIVHEQRFGFAAASCAAVQDVELGRRMELLLLRRGDVAEEAEDVYVTEAFGFAAL